MIFESLFEHALFGVALIEIWLFGFLTCYAWKKGLLGGKNK